MRCQIKFNYWSLAFFMMEIVGLFLASPGRAETLIPAKFEDQSPREDLRKKFFVANPALRDCVIVTKDPTGKVDQDKSLSTLVESLVKALQNGDDQTLKLFFHPQVRVKTSQIKATLTSIERITGGKVQFSLFRAYALNSPDGETSSLDCHDEGLQIHPLFGHPLQVAVWIQASGHDEVGRVFALLVPKGDRWLIGAWTVQQWTHGGQDFTKWRADGESLAAKKQYTAAWIYFDIAEKLLESGKFLEFPEATVIGLEKKKLLKSSLLEELQPLFANELGDHFVYAASLFSRKGAALLLRFRIDKEWSAHAIQEHCQAKVKRLSKESWSSSLAGVRCDYVLPRESIEKDGILGGIFIAQDGSIGDK